MTTPSFAPLTASLVEFCQAIQGVLETNIAELSYDGDPGSVWYGEQNRYPTVPAYAVEPVRKDRDLGAQQMSRIFDLYFTAQVIGYLARVDLDDQVIRVDVDVLGEKIEDILHRDHKLGGLTLDLVVSSLESGYAYIEKAKYKAVILTVQGRSKQALPC